MIRYLDKVRRKLVLIVPKTSGYFKIFKFKDGDKEMNNKLISFCIDDGKALKKYKIIMTKIEDLRITELNAY